MQPRIEQLYFHEQYEVARTQEDKADAAPQQQPHAGTPPAPQQKDRARQTAQQAKIVQDVRKKD